MSIKATGQITICAIDDNSEVIVGTQTQVTGAWEGNATFAQLKDGQQITYWLPYNGSGNATLNLTLSDGTQTGAINCYYMGTARLTTHFTAGTPIRLTYRENTTIGSGTTTYTGWWADANYNSDTFDRIRFNTSIKAKSAISASRLIVGDSVGYYHLAANVSFDTTKQILFAASAISANGTGTNNYLSCPDLTLRNNLSNFTGTSAETCFLVGTLSGTTFTPNDTLFTTAKPTSEDGLVYISLGRMYSTYQIYLYPEHPMYRFVDGKFKSFAEIAYDAQVNLDELGVIGKNLLKGTRDFSGSPITSSMIVPDTYQEGCSVAHSIYLGTEDRFKNVCLWDNIDDVEPNTKYTLSFWAKGSGSITSYFYPLCVSSGISSTGATTVSTNGTITTTITDEWTRYWITWTTLSTASGEKTLIPCRQVVGTACDVYIAGIKFEKSNRASDYTDNPDEIDERITEAKILADTNKGLIELAISSESSSSSIILKPNFVSTMTKEAIFTAPDGSSTVIQGGKFLTDSISSDMVATDAIKSRNYYAGTSELPYSVVGTFIDLSNGYIYTPYLGLNGTGAYFNGTVNMFAGRIGEPDSSYWEVATEFDENANDYASLRAKGNASIVAGKWRLTNDKFSSFNSGSYVLKTDDNTYYDFGVKVPDMNGEDTTVPATVRKKFLYIRRHTGSIPTSEADWEYLAGMDYDGTIYENGMPLNQKYASIDGVSGAYLPMTGGTLTGNLIINGGLTVSGTISGVANFAKQLEKSISVNGKTFNGLADVTVGTIGVGYGGTGKTSWTPYGIVYATSASALGQLAVGTSGYILRSNGSAAPTWITQSSLSVGVATKATQDANGNVINTYYMPLSGGIFTGEVDFNSAAFFNGSTTIDDLTAGNVIVTGSARFINGLIGNLTGNVAGNAGTATKLANTINVTIGNSTKSTDLSSALSFSLTEIGASASGHTHSYLPLSGGTLTGNTTLQNTAPVFTIKNTSNTDVALLFDRNTAANWKILVKDGNMYFQNDWNNGTRTSFFDVITLQNTTGNATFKGTVTSTGFIGNASTASKWATSRTIALTGAVTGNVSIDGSGNVSMETSEGDVSFKRMGAVDASTDWNTLTTPGCYKVGMTTWGDADAVHSPNEYATNLYSYGLLLVFKSNVEDGNRTVQIYIPHAQSTTTQATTTIRMLDTTTWTTWNPVFRGVTKAYIGLGNVNNTADSAKNVLSATKLTTARNIVVGNKTMSFDGSANISATLAEIGAATSGHTHNYASKVTLNGVAYSSSSNNITITRANLLTALGAASTSANGYMSSDDKSKLDRINISDIGTVGADSIIGTNGIVATTSDGVATISHGNSGVTAGSFGASSTNYYRIPNFTVNATGHITVAGYYDITASNLVARIGTTAVTNATNATKATNDSDGNAINTTYLKKTGGTVSGTTTFATLNATTGTITNLTVSGSLDATSSKATADADGNVITSTYLKKAGDSMTGLLSANKGIAIPTVSSSWLSSRTQTQLLLFTGATTAGFHPMLRYQTSNAHDVILGAHRDKVGFFGFKSETTSNSNNSYAYLDVANSRFAASKFYGELEGNADTATKLLTARTINGTSFNGTANIVTSYWGTARNFTLGNTTKSVNGSGNISYTLAEIGAVDKAGDTMTGELKLSSANALRLTYGDYGLIFRHTDDFTYFLLTDSGDVDGAYNSLRPLSINHSTGRVSTSNGFTAGGGFISSSGAVLQSTLSVTGTSTFTGQTTHSGGLASTTGTFSSTLGVTGATTLSSTLSVTGASTFTGAATFGVVRANGVYANRSGSVTAYGLSLYSTLDPSVYGITLRNNLGEHGGLSSSVLKTLFCMGTTTTETTRGWVFRNSSASKNVASITTDGDAQFDGNVKIGTEGCTLHYNETTKSLDFIFG